MRAFCSNRLSYPLTCCRSIPSHRLSIFKNTIIIEIESDGLITKRTLCAQVAEPTLVLVELGVASSDEHFSRRPSLTCRAQGRCPLAAKALNE